MGCRGSNDNGEVADEEMTDAVNCREADLWVSGRDIGAYLVQTLPCAGVCRVVQLGDVLTVVVVPDQAEEGDYRSAGRAAHEGEQLVRGQLTFAHVGE